MPLPRAVNDGSDKSALINNFAVSLWTVRSTSVCVCIACIVLMLGRVASGRDASCTACVVKAYLVSCTCTKSNEWPTLLVGITKAAFWHLVQPLAGLFCFKHVLLLPVAVLKCKRENQMCVTCLKAVFTICL